MDIKHFVCLNNIFRLCKLEVVCIVIIVIKLNPMFDSTKALGPWVTSSTNDN